MTAPVKLEDLIAQYQVVNKAAGALAAEASKLVNLGPKNDAVSVSAYEFNRRLEDAMHRVSDIIAIHSRQDPSVMSKMVDDKLATGDVVTTGLSQVDEGKTIQFPGAGSGAE